METIKKQQNCAEITEFEKEIIKTIFSDSSDISQARSSLALNEDLKKIFETFRFKTEESNKHGKCLITLSRKDGIGKDISIPVHLHHIDRDASYPSREKILLNHH